MSRLKELIEELCPNGVEVKNIEELCNISRGRVMSKDYIKENQGEYPVYSSQTENNGELGKIKTYDFDGEYLTWTTDGANAGSVFYRKGKFSVTNVCGLLEVKNKEVLSKFLYYELSVEAPKYVNAGMGNPKLMSNVMARIKVAVPPLEVQREIVHILDDFTLLSAELSAELKARQSQYEYYRDKLLMNNDKNQFVKLGEITDLITKGTTPSTFTNTGINFIKTESFNNGVIDKEKLKYIDKETHEGKLKRSNLKENDLLFTIAGATIGKMAVVTNDLLPANTNQALAIIRLKKGINNQYIKFVLGSKIMREYISKCVKGSAQPNLNLQQLNEFDVPYPEKEIQEKIVYVLNNFEKISTDLNIGLPAEIKARQKQYEFYRDTLLTYAATGEIIFKDKTRQDKTRQDKTRQDKDKTRQDKTRKDKTLLD